MLWRPTWGWAHAAAAAFSTSLLIEISQAIIRPERFATWTDLAANTAGGVIGGLLVIAGRQVVRR
jgi:glycopeptide antibiotics resistance protein